MAKTAPVGRAFTKVLNDVRAAALKSDALREGRLVVDLEVNFKSVQVGQTKSGVFGFLVPLQNTSQRSTMSIRLATRIEVSKP